MTIGPDGTGWAGGNAQFALETGVVVDRFVVASDLRIDEDRAEQNEAPRSKLRGILRNSP